mmetsp:Transcript_45767/g.76122  ORF Transcript_45767/g.76122 Transcript_45767/m.76122 type:complete len:293 (-) Transcript_45767:213-1091(-)
MVLAQFQKLENVRMPRFEIHGKRAFALATALIHVTRGIVEHAQHWHDTVRGAIGAFNVRALAANAMNRHANAARILADLRALLERVINALNRVVLHREQETRRQLRSLRASIEQGRRRVRKPFLRHEIVRLDGGVHVVVMNAQTHTHQHMLRAFRNLTGQLEQVRFGQRLDAEIVVAIVAAIHNGRIKLLFVRHHNVVDTIRDQRTRLAIARVNVAIQVLHHLAKHLLRVLLQVAHLDTRRQHAIVGMTRHQMRRSLRCQLVELRCSYASIDSSTNFLSDFARINFLRKTPR